MIAALLLLMTAFSHVDLVDETFEIPANDWRYVPRALTQEPAMVDCIYESDRRDAQVRVVLVSQEDLNLWRVGREHDEIATTPVGPRGTLRMSIHDPGSYIAVENRSAQLARVRLRVFLEQPHVQYLSRGRQLAVIAISFGVFFGIVVFSGRRLLRAIKTK